MTSSESHAGENQTFSDGFILVGFSYIQNLQSLLFVVFPFAYLFTLMANLFIVLLVKLNHTLHSPMYFLLANLSFTEVSYTTSITPQLLIHLLMEEKTITFAGCAAQMYVLSIAGLAACFFLAGMAYDRYVAICHPLQYTTIMSGKVRTHLVVTSWVISILVAVAHLTWIFSQPFCGSNQINHLYCDTQMVDRLLCNYSWKNVGVGLFVLVVFVMGPFLMIILSYICIISTILKLPSAEGRSKAFSTCSSHLMMVILSYGSALLSNLNYTSGSNAENLHLMSLTYTFLSPVLNPIIYTLRNKEVKGALRNTLEKVIFHTNRGIRE